MRRAVAVAALVAVGVGALVLPVVALLAGCSATRPGGVLYVDPSTHPWGGEEVDCGNRKFCPSDTVCGPSPACAAGQCCPESGGDFGHGMRQIPQRSVEGGVP